MVKCQGLYLAAQQIAPDLDGEQVTALSSYMSLWVLLPAHGLSGSKGSRACLAGGTSVNLVLLVLFLLLHI